MLTTVTNIEKHLAFSKKVYFKYWCKLNKINSHQILSYKNLPYTDNNFHENFAFGGVIDQETHYMTQTTNKLSLHIFSGIHAYP